MIYRNCLLGFLCLLSFGLLTAQDAVTLTACHSYLTPDDSDSTHAVLLESGTGLFVTGISSEIFAEDHEHRKFYWYHVRDFKGRDGWVKGEFIATSLAAQDLPSYVLAFDTSQVNYARDFGLARLWFAAAQTVGRDVSDGDSFTEYYVVLGNASGRQITYPLAMQNSQGATRIAQFMLTDINKDKNPDIVMLKQSKPDFGNTTWSFEVLSVLQGRFIRLLEKNVTLLDTKGDPSPLQAECMDIEPGIIRFESIRYLPCNELAEKNATFITRPVSEDCLIMESSSLTWSVEQRKFVPLYEPAQVIAMAKVNTSGVGLYQKPDAKSPLNAYVFEGEQLKVISVFREYGVDSSKKKYRTDWFYVIREDDTKGYVNGKFLNWPRSRHQQMIQEWCKSSALTIFDFQPEFTFIRLRE